MTNEQIISNARRHVLRPLGYAQMFFAIVLAASPFIWIWLGWSVAWRTGLTGLIGMAMIALIYRVCEILIANAFKEIAKDAKSETYKNMLHERLVKMAEDRETAQDKK